MASCAASAAVISSQTSLGSRLACKGGAGALITPNDKRRRNVVMMGAGRKIQTKQPFGPSGDFNFRNGVDASGRKAKGKGVYQFADKYGANVDGYSPIYTPEEWSPTGGVYAGGTLVFHNLVFFGSVSVSFSVVLRLWVACI
eukprot:TRINITY_DN358_c0_g1_i1.p1 TRINITY_DN358_c0_g1~~TRINITY_DN358_c0_g1_i1.p1  ORF type:complete len:142 (-),score=35.20 TRINITY_DN358_c0_g1_i1:461-886(-)